tara:strand:- start:308 stop:496 length:189 start_codon:yes stop_codon:yes gene_type:complete
MSKVRSRMKELMRPVEQQILMCDDSNDILMLACAMLDRVKIILDSQLGEVGRKTVIESANKK